MAFTYTTYSAFTKYCLGILGNKKIRITNQIVKIFEDFECVLNKLVNLEKEGIIEIYSDIPKCIVDSLIKDPYKALEGLNKAPLKLKQVLTNEINSYLLLSYMFTMFSIDTQYTISFIYGQKDSPLYPEKIAVYTICDGSYSLNTLKKIDEDLLDKKGIYFIYDTNDTLAYIGKSTSSCIKRSLSSADERNLLDFSKIEYRFISNSSEIGIYEAYYIALYKPYLNIDMIFNDEITFTIPELEINYTLERDSTEQITTTFSFYKEEKIYTTEFLNNPKYEFKDPYTKIELERKGIFDWFTASNNAYKECVKKAKENIIVGRI